MITNLEQKMNLIFLSKVLYILKYVNVLVMYYNNVKILVNRNSMYSINKNLDHFLI